MAKLPAGDVTDPNLQPHDWSKQNTTGSGTPRSLRFKLELIDQNFDLNLKSDLRAYLDRAQGGSCCSWTWQARGAGRGVWPWPVGCPLAPHASRAAGEGTQHAAGFSPALARSYWWTSKDDSAGTCWGKQKGGRQL